MEGDGRVGEYVGGYSDWLRQRSMAAAPVTSSEAAGCAARTRRREVRRRNRSASSATRMRANSNSCPDESRRWSTRIAALTEAMHDPAFYQRDRADIETHHQSLAAAQGELDLAYARWSELEG